MADAEDPGNDSYRGGGSGGLGEGGRAETALQCLLLLNIGIAQYSVKRTDTGYLMSREYKKLYGNVKNHNSRPGQLHILRSAIERSEPQVCQGV